MPAREAIHWQWNSWRIVAGIPRDAAAMEDEGTS